MSIPSIDQAHAEQQRLRLDVTLVVRNMATSRERAQGLISAGLVEVDGQIATSSATLVESGADIRLIGRDHPWVGRGGVKLAAALDEFGVDCTGVVALDGGASTGGFADVLLTRGAARVYAIDVGYGQLDGKIAGDERVEVHDRTNLRTLAVLDGPTPTLVTLDLSFISLRHVLPNVARLCPGASVVALFKPQFELGPENVGKGGIVRDIGKGERGAHEFLQWAETTVGAETLAPPFASPLKGTKGNQEWLLYFRLPEAQS